MANRGGAAILLALIALALPGCSAAELDASAASGGDEAPAAETRRMVPRPTTSTPIVKSLAVVYFQRDDGDHSYLVPERHAVPGAQPDATGAIRELLRGAPVFAGSRPPFPEGTRLLDSQLADGVLTVNLSRDAVELPAGWGGGQLALQALVFTATEVPGVKAVEIHVEGRSSGVVAGRDLANLWGGYLAGPIGRNPAVEVAPITLVQPLPGTRVPGSRVVVKGEASVASGAVNLRLLGPKGKVRAQGSAPTAAVPPERSPFTGSLAFDPPPRRERWTLQAFEADTQDGTVIYHVDIPVVVGG